MRRSLLLLLAPFSLFADKVLHHYVPDQPWLTGPLLAPSGYVVPAGHANYEPYIYITAFTGLYDNHWHAVKNDHPLWSNNFQPSIQVGLTSWLDFQILPTLNYNYTDHQAKWTLGDLPLGFDIQLYMPQNPINSAPAIKLSIKESFPLGKYRNLDPKKQGADFGGVGSFLTSFGLAFGNLWYFKDVYFMTTRLFLEYTLPSPIRLKGFNFYGGGVGTNARFFPRQNFQIDFAIEVTLSKNWAFACDFLGSWFTKSHFSGAPGVTSSGQPARLGIPHFGSQYSLAPALEYNWNAHVGIIAGSWFTFAGKNAPSFWSGIVAVNYYQ